MPTQKPQQKQTKVTQKVGGNPKKPVTKATQGGKVATPMQTKKVKEGGMGLYDETKKRSLRNEQSIANIKSSIAKIEKSILEIENIKNKVTDHENELKALTVDFNFIYEEVFPTR